MASPEAIFARAELRHVHLVARRMRPNDEAEVMASGGYRPAQALRAALRASELARTLFIAGEAAAMFGVVAGESWSIPWALTTDVVDRYPRAFWRASKTAIAKMRELYPLMVQNIDARYPQALRWVARLGFQVEEPAPFGRAGLPFHRITMIGAS